jgi:uncharacterized protein Veg
MQQADISKVRASVHQQCGSKVMIQLDRGRNKVDIQQGDLYLTSNAIIFDTELIGPRKGETISKSPSYPYIVVKVELRDENVVFE